MSAETAPLAELRRQSLNLHQLLLAAERTRYEHQHGPITSNGRFLQLLINDPWFAWIQPFTQWIVRLDEALEDPAASGDSAWFQEALQLFVHEGSASDWEKQWLSACQRSVQVSAARAQLSRFLKTRLEEKENTSK